MERIEYERKSDDRLEMNMCGCVDKSPPALSSPYCCFDFGIALRRMKPRGTEVH